jgi:mRNA interferase RelE/StbE
LTTIFKVIFRPRAKKRFDKLDKAVQRQIARKLLERCDNPRVPSAALAKLPHCYKVKIKKPGIRLVYLVRDAQLILLVLSVGLRERGEAYEDAELELGNIDH